MARIRTLAIGIAAWIALASTASSAPVSWFESQAALTAWYANQLNGSYSPGPSNTISNVPFYWYRPTVSSATSATVATSSTSTSSTEATTSIPAATYTPTASTYAPTATYTPTASTTAAAVTSVSSPVSQAVSSPQADAYINMGSGPYALADTITTGTAQPWYNSPSAVAAYGGTPTADQQTSFENDVLSKVERTFALSGVDVNLTTDPTVSAEHEMSVVSGASYGPNPDAIGITQVGDDGFSFIDKLNYASTPDQLSWAVAHNVAHELMHALGVGSHPDSTGDYIDSAVADWSLLTDPNARFSPSAVALINAVKGTGVDSGSLGAEILKSGILSAQCSCPICGAQGGLEGEQVLATPVPEPTTIAVWGAGLIGGLVLHRRRRAA